MNHIYLKQIVNTFIVRDRRDRLLSLLANKKRYDDFLENLLRDTRYFDPACIISIPSNEQTPEKIFQHLVSMDANELVYIVSTDLDLDGRSMKLKKAITTIACTLSESLIFSPNPKLAYYEGHEGWRHILKQSRK